MAEMEKLEARQFLSATLDQGVLTVFGTHKADLIQLTIDRGTTNQITVSVNGAASRFLLSDVQKISIDGGAGDDVISVDRNQPKLIQPTTIFGAAGNDTISGGAGSDRILGGDGNDVIDGGPGRDIIYGEAGNDRIDGNTGNDFIDGGVGKDTLQGSAGINTLEGNAGNDLINARNGDVDSVDGGSGVDTAFTDKLDGVTDIDSLNPAHNPFA
jgi:Ca2+-binding RTX toxin-like protein